MAFHYKDAWRLIKTSLSAWSDDRAARLGAALAFYTVFSLAPLLIIIIGVTGLFFGEEAARGELFDQLENFFGSESAYFIQTMLENSRDKQAGLWATFIGFSSLLLGATGVLVQLQDALDTIWQAKPATRNGILVFLKARITSLGIILGIGFLLITSLALSAILSAFASYLGRWMPWMAPGLHLFDLILSFSIITALFAMIYKILPNVKIAWNDVWAGAAATAFLFSIGKIAIGAYLARSAVSSTFGAAGTFIILLLWIYYSAQIFLLGAEFTKTYARRHGSHQTIEARAQANQPAI